MWVWERGKLFFVPVTTSELWAGGSVELAGSAAETGLAYSVFFCLQSEERQVGHANVNLDIDIFVISGLKWLKFGLQAHLFKMFGYAKFQLPIFFTYF